MGMANTLEKATGHDKLAGALKDYCEFFAEQTKIRGQFFDFYPLSTFLFKFTF